MSERDGYQQTVEAEAPPTGEVQAAPHSASTPSRPNGTGAVQATQGDADRIEAAEVRELMLRQIAGALRTCIRAHGPIDGRWVGSAAKRVANQLLASSADRCDSCRGRYRFDTSVPSVMWNSVIRAAGLPDYLCLSCVVRAFAKAGVSFTALLHGDGFGGLPIGIEVNGRAAIDAARLQDENSALRWRIRDLESKVDG